MRSAMIAILLALVMAAAGAAQQEEDALDPDIVTKIEELGGKIMRVARNDPSVEISFHLGRNQDGLRQLDVGKSDGQTPPALDGELEVLKSAGKIVSLHFGGTDITDAGVAQLAELASLKRLHLERTKISDGALVHLASLGNLEYLNLYETGVTDSGLVHLKGLKNLRNLYLWQTKVTPDGASDLKQALPECDVDLGWEEPEPEPEEEQDSSEPEA